MIRNIVIFLSVALPLLSCVTQPEGGQGGGSWSFLPLMIAIFAVFYLLLIYPKQREQKKHMAMLSKLKKGDEVITSAGIHGKVVGVTDRIVVLRIAENCKIEVEKNYIAAIVQK